MSLKFPISLVGKRSSVDLTANLLEWWDDADIIGKHNSISLGATPGTTITGPNGWNAWNLNGTNCVAGVTGAGYPIGPYPERTAAFVVYRNGDASETGPNSLLGAGIGALGGNNNHYIGSVFSQRFELRQKGSRFRLDGFIQGAWGSLVWAESIDGNASLYWNGSLVVQTAVGDFSAAYSVNPWQTYLVSPSIDVAVACLADRSWTQDDVTAFHNGGTFLQYADL